MECRNHAGIIIILTITLALILGCAPKQVAEEENVTEEQVEIPPTSEAKPQETPKSEYVPSVPTLNETNDTAEEPTLKISGSLKLQANTGLCPHLARGFECDKYDLRNCNFKETIGQKGFYPDMLTCRPGYTYKGELENRRYCLIQECSPIEKSGIVEAYGGKVAYAEYIYSEEKTATGILTKYALLRCGEEENEFPTSAGCRQYGSDFKIT